MTLSIFSHAFWPSICLLWRNVYLDLPPMFWLGCFLILSCMSCLYILEINSLSVALFANIFSHSKGCLFVLFMASFAVQKLLSLIRSHLFIFVFIYFRSWINLQNTQGAHAQNQKNLKLSNKKMGRRPEQTFLQRRYI